MDLFWFLKQTETLLYIKHKIEILELQLCDLTELDYGSESTNIPTPSYLSVLGSFRDAEDDFVRVAVELILNYALKRPQELRQIQSLFTHRFGFDKTSYLRHYRVQKAVVDTLIKRLDNGDDTSIVKLFLSVAEEYLKIKFNVTEFRARNKVVWYDFQPTFAAELVELRQAIWATLFSLYQQPTHREPVRNILRTYVSAGFRSTGNEILVSDSEEILQFFSLKFDTESYQDCILVQKYLEMLDSCGISYDASSQVNFTNDIFRLSQVILTDRTEKKLLDMGNDEYQRYRTNQIRVYFRGFLRNDYQLFFEQCQTILSETYHRNQVSRLGAAIEQVLLVLAEENPNLYPEILEHYLELGDPFSLPTPLPVAKLIEIVGSENGYEVVSRYNYPTRTQWLFKYFETIPLEGIRPEHPEQIRCLYEVAKAGEIPHNFDFLLKFYHLDDTLLTQIVEIILDKYDTDPDFAVPLSWLFIPHTEIGLTLVDVIPDIELLKRAYLAIPESESYVDFDGQSLNRILDFDSAFILTYIDHIYDNGGWRERFNDHRDFSFLWQREDYIEIMKSVIERVYVREQEDFYDSYLHTFFGLQVGSERDPATAIKERQDRFLEEIVYRCHEYSEFMEFVFNLIAQFAPGRRRHFLRLFIQLNGNLNDFRRLSLEPTSSSWSGSAVPMLQERLEYYDSLLSMLNTVEFLEHRQYIEQRIEGIRKRIELEKKSDFLDD